MFTGDGPRGAGDFLMAALHRAGLASRPTSQGRDDGLELRGAYLTAVCRCAPPGNRPTREEIGNCLPYMVEELRVLADVRAVLALGRVAFDGCLRVLEAIGATVPRPRPRFVHGSTYDVGTSFPLLVASYHPSRQNTQTGRLTEAMLDEAVRRAWRAVREMSRGERSCALARENDQRHGQEPPLRATFLSDCPLPDSSKSRR